MSKSFKIASIIYGVLLLLWVVLNILDILSYDPYSPFFQYSQNLSIRIILYGQLVFSTVAVLYYVNWYRSGRLEKLYENKLHFIINVAWLVSFILLKFTEIQTRDIIPYYGEVKDKHGDERIYFIISYPIIFAVYYYLHKQGKESK